MKKLLIIIILWIGVFSQFQHYSLTKNQFENNPIQQRLLLSKCHYSCQECDGSTEQDCLKCKTGIGRYYDQINRMCLCEINLFDIGVEECQIFDEAVPSGLLIQENLMYEEFCKFGQFKVLIENNRFFCLDCPKSVNNNLNCLDCYFNPETWYKQPKCTSDFVKVKNDENYGYLMQIRDEIEFETFLISELFQLMSTPYYQQICSDNQLNQDGNNCKLMNQKHLEKQLYAVCKDYTYYDQNQCIQCPLFCSKCNNNQCLNCVDHTYLYNGLCYECPKQCKECQYNIQSNMVECNQCYEYFGLVQGKCIECGLNCVFCMFWSFFDSYYGIWIEFLRCLQCIDNSKYHISSNGLDCKENQLQNCLHTYQTNDLYYYSSSTYDYRLRKFQNAINGCARCEDHFDVDQSGNCVPSENLIESCLFVYRYGNEETYCLISDYSWSQQNNKCFEIISNCQECILEQWTEKLLCILCQPGYYAHRLFGYCIQCPQELNCRVCSQQQTLFQDGWVYKIRSFYEGVMNAVYVETENTIPKTFRTAGQSQNIADYEVICNICQDGFQLHNNICILNCPNGCLECKIQNNQNICLKCQNDEYGRIQSLVDNKCLSCPSNCKLCTPRTFDQIKHLNPYFNDNKYQNFANRCVNSTGLSTFSYDPDFNFFINCESQQHLCQNVLTVSLLLYCDQEQYNQNLISQSDTQLKKLRFLKTTLFLDDLLNNSFQYFENDWFYSLLNRKQIRKLTIKILTQESQDCYFKNKVQIAQLFRSHVFSLNSVNLEFVGTQNNKFYIFDSVEFHNFTSISFEAINLDFKTSSFIDQQTVKFHSIQKQDIQFKNLKILQENENTQNINIQFKNINFINILDVQIQRLNLNSTYGLFQFIQSDDYLDNTGTIKFSNLNIQQTNLINSQIINYQISNPFVIYFENISLNLNLTNSQFFSSNIIYNFGNLIIHQLKIIDSILKNSSQLISGEFLKLIEINSIILNQNQFDYSNLILLNKNITVQNLKIENCVLLNSNLILNHLVQKSNSDIFYLFQFKNFSLTNNRYNQDAKYMTIYRYTSTFSNIIIEQLKIDNNTCIDNQNLNQKKQSSALIILESNEIELKNLEIYKQSGIPDFAIINSQNLIINNLYITSHSDKYDLFLQKQQSKIRDLGIIFHIYSVKQVRFNNFSVISLFIHKNPIIYYEQATKTLINQDAYIEVVNSHFLNNLLFQNDQFNTNLFEIFSEQKVMINFLNTTFENNIIYFLTKGTTVQSTNLINIDCFECSVQLRELNFNDNIAINTTSSILLIKAYDLQIIESNFENNGQITNQAIEFFDHISLEYDNRVFYQGSGNGIFQTDFMYVNNSNFHNQYGSRGASLSYSPLNQGFLKIESTKIDTSQNYFSLEKEEGGAIYIGSSTVDVQLEFLNCQFYNIQSFQGGLLTIDSPQHSIQILFNNSIIQNSFSLYGSLVYVNFEELYIDSSFLQLQDIQISNTLEGFSKFCQLFYNNQSHKIQEKELFSNLQILLYERSMIYSKLGKIRMKNIQMSGIINEIIVQDQQIRLLQINQVTIQNSSISNQGLINIQPQQNQNFSININSFFGENLYINTNETQLELQKYKKLIRKNIFGILNIVNIHKDGYMEFRNIKFQNNICSNCQAGLMNFQFKSYSKNILNIYDLIFWQNKCGKRGCLNIIKDKIDSSSTNDLDNQRLLESINSNNNLSFVFNIQNYYCYNNQGTYGVCLFVQNLAGQINEAIFAQNNAEISGGAIYSFGNKSNLILMRTQVIENVASYGGGLSIQNHFFPNLLSYETLSFENKAMYYGNDYAEYPTHIVIQINNYNQFNYKQKSVKTKENTIQIITATQNQQELNSIMLPSAQHLNLYEQFDWKNNNYIMMNYTLRLIPYDQRNDRIKNLTNSKCFIKGRLFDFNKLEQSELKEFRNNFTNKNEVLYDNQIEQYNFDDLIIYFDPDLPDNIVLQFEFKCDSIRIPIINDNLSQDTIIDKSEEFYLRLNIKTLPCQIGELKDEKDLSCHPCDYSQDLYSVNFNSERCRIRDNIQMESVKSAQIKLRPSFWRPYFYADLIENCYNFQFNCLGGWNYGDKSCSQGHIGALCEQCDIYNTRGEGSYSISSKFKCGSCEDTNANTLIIIGISLWTLISISISVKSTVDIIKQLARASKLKSIGITIVVTKNNAVNLIKILTNYLQIISSISTFQLQLPQNMESVINSLGNPVETMAYSLDCFLKDIFQNIFIHYSRTIWQLIMPIIYILLFFQLYGVGVLIKFVDFSFCVISTTLIYMFIYLQPNIIAGQIGLLSYRTISGFQWILGNVANRYDTQDHMKWLISYSFPVLFTFGVLIPGLLFNRLYKIKDNLNIMQNRLILGYLYNEYKGSAYYWEIIKIIQKELIIIFLTFYQDQILVKAVLVYGIIFIYNYLTLQIFPYQAMQLNVLDHQSTRICGFSIVLAIGIYGSLQNGILEVQIPFYIIMTIINFLFIAKLMLFIIKAYFEKFAIVIDKLRDFVRTNFPQLQQYPFLQKILKNQQQTSLRAQKNFRKIKIAIIMISKQIIQNKKTMTQQERKGTFIFDTKKTLNIFDQMQNEQHNKQQQVMISS